MKLNENRIDIYPGIMRIVAIILGSSLFIAGGCCFINNPRKDLDVFMGYLGIVFFSLGIFVGVGWLILMLMRKPFVCIYDDRLEYLIAARRKYIIIPFKNVKMFAVAKERIKIIIAEYLDGGLEYTEINNGLVPVDKVCELLNARLREYRTSKEETFNTLHKENKQLT